MPIRPETAPHGTGTSMPSVSRPQALLRAVTALVEKPVLEQALLVQGQITPKADFVVRPRFEVQWSMVCLQLLDPDGTVGSGPFEQRIEERPPCCGIAWIDTRCLGQRVSTRIVLPPHRKERVNP